jgi:hypothetical protein
VPLKECYLFYSPPIFKLSQKSDTVKFWAFGLWEVKLSLVDFTDSRRVVRGLLEALADFIRLWEYSLLLSKPGPPQPQRSRTEIILPRIGRCQISISLRGFVSQWPRWGRKTFSLPVPPGKEKIFFSPTSVSVVNRSLRSLDSQNYSTLCRHLRFPAEDETGGLLLQVPAGGYPTLFNCRRSPSRRGRTRHL